MPTKVEIGYRSQSYGYAESDGDTIYCSGARRKVIKLLIEGMALPDDDGDIDRFLNALPERLHSRFWARIVEHLTGQHDQKTHASGYGATLADQLNQKYPHCKFDFTGVGPGIAKKVSKQIDTLFQDYPDVAKSVGYIGTGDNMLNAPTYGKGMMAVARNNYPSNGQSSIFLNRDMFGDVEHAEDLFEESKKANWFAGDYTLQSMVSHEFGHCVDYYLRGANRQSLFGFRGPEGNGTIDDIVAEFKAKNEAHGAQVSGYAKRGGPAEAWAEAFSSHYHGSNMSPYAKAQKALLAEIFPASKWQKASIKATPEQLAKRSQFYRKHVYIS